MAEVLENMFMKQREELHKGSVHYCPKGHKHTMVNDHEEDLVYFAVVPEQ